MFTLTPEQVLIVQIALSYYIDAEEDYREQENETLLNDAGSLLTKLNNIDAAVQC